MGVGSFVKRVKWYYNKHGWLRLGKLTVIKLWSRVNRKEYINLIDLNMLEVDNTFNLDGITVVAYKKELEISPEDMEQLVKLKSKEILLPFLEKCFHRGATLWLAKKEESIVSLFWSLNGGFNGFYIGIPICPNETILFSGETFSEFRGRNYFAIMIILICKELKLTGISRAYVGAHIYNEASQKAQSKILKRIGAVRHFELNNCHIVIWDKKYLMTDFK